MEPLALVAWENVANVQIGKNVLWIDHDSDLQFSPRAWVASEDMTDTSGSNQLLVAVEGPSIAR